MRFLVLSVTSGYGHHAMGNAVIECMKNAGHETLLVDYLRPSTKLRAKLAHELYFWTLKNFPKSSHKTYLKIMERDVTKEPSKFNAFTYMTSSKKANEGIEKVIEDFKPDMIYCTHVYTASVMSRLKKEGKYLDIPTFFTVSDYTIHAYTETATNIDYLLTPNDDLNDKLFEMGWKKEQLLPFGITVNTKFSTHKASKEETRIKLGLNPNYPTFMIMNGGVGFGDTLSLIKQLSEIKDRNFQLIVINGRNEKMKEKIDEFISTGEACNCLNLGFASNVDELMDASDLLIGKIGGVAIAEAFNKGMPILVAGNAPFQEWDNVIYLEKRNAIVFAKNEEESKSAILDLIDNPSKLESLKENVRNIAKPNATQDFVNFMTELYNNKKEG